MFSHIFLFSWSEGKPCEECQQDLFHRIQDGYYEFPEEEWGMISEEAKDLVSNLLKRDPVDRFVLSLFLFFVFLVSLETALTTIAQWVTRALFTLIAVVLFLLILHSVC